MKTGDKGERHFIRGMLSGAISRVAIEPLDVIKIHMQLQESSASVRIIPTVRRIYSAEGIGGFWKGNVFGISLYTVYSGVQFYLFHTLPIENAFALGAVSGLLATVVSYPLDVMRTRFCVRNRNSLSSYTGILDGIAKTATGEGIRGFYRGIGTTLMQIVPAAGISLWTFEFARRRLFSHWKSKELTNLASGALAGTVSKAATMPFDVLRKRLQVQCPLKDQFLVKSSNYASLPDAIRKIWLKEGVKGFYKGLSAALLKNVPVTSISFFVFYHNTQKKEYSNKDQRKL